MKAMAAFAALYADRTAAARAWKARGGKVVGYLCDNVPDELISAAGFMPLRVSGDPGGGIELVRGKIDRLYPPDLTVRPAFVTSMLERLLSGAYDVLDYLIIPHGRDSVQAIYRQLQDAAGADPRLRLPVLHYLDKAWAGDGPSEKFNAARISDLKTTLEAWSGKRIEDADLRRAVAAVEENRGLLRQVAELRSARPSRLSGADVLRITAAAMFMPREEHSALLRELLAEVAQLPTRAGPRIFVGGSPQDHVEVYDAIESLGATVVGEDHCWGERTFEAGLELDIDPMQALAARFHARPACTVLFPLAEGRRACAKRAALAGADGAIFYVVSDDWTQNWETPGQAKAVEAAGVPVLRLMKQPYAPDRKAIEAEVAAFVEGLRTRVRA